MNEGFGRAQLEKYGWEEGKGLGKSETGIKSAIKPSLKFDKNGIGYDIGEEFSFRWWEQVFNKTAKNIKVVNSEDKVEITRTENESSKISTRKSHMSLEKHTLMYGSFIKGSTHNTEEIKIDESTENCDDCDSKYSYEDIFKKCKGRTGHKAARHGIKMNGKLKRIEQQENELLRINSCVSDEKLNKCDNLLKKLKKKKKENRKRKK
ncbi:G patch domain-containing protein 4 [Centruroides vittatus]|uniref:G patch domain-containing protein 4 n=1 Tax=Centruroides vittatus TaxID=120091 RepID=UPI00350F4B21